MRLAVVSPMAADARDDDRTFAFRSLAELHLEGSYRLARVILTDPSEAEDAVHDAFVTAWSNWASLRDQALFERCFQRIVVNTCRDRLRHGARWQVRESNTCGHVLEQRQRQVARAMDAVLGA